MRNLVMTSWMSSPDSAARMQDSFAQAGMVALGSCHTVSRSSAPYDSSIHGAPQPVLHARHGRHVAAQDVHVEAEVRHVHQRHLPRQAAVRSPRCCLCPQHRCISLRGMLRCTLRPGMSITVISYAAIVSQQPVTCTMLSPWQLYAPATAGQQPHKERRRRRSRNR